MGGRGKKSQSGIGTPQDPIQPDFDADEVNLQPFLGFLYLDSKAATVNYYEQYIEQGSPDNLTEDEVNTILNYTIQGFKIANDTPLYLSALNEFAAMKTPEVQAAIKKYRDNLDQSLSKVRSTTALKVYRGERDPGSFTFNSLKAKIGHEITASNFTSTSTETHAAFNSTLRYVITPRSSNSRGKSIEHLSAHSAEREVLFMRNTKFRVTRAEKGKHTDIIYLEEI